MLGLYDFHCYLMLIELCLYVLWAYFYFIILFLHIFLSFIFSVIWVVKICSIHGWFYGSIQCNTMGLRNRYGYG